MEQEEYNTVEDFVFNKSFQEWVLNNDPYSTKYWLNWVSYNPDKASLINYSRAIVDSLPSNKREAPEDEINDFIEKIIYTHRNQLLPPHDPVMPPPKARVLVVSKRNWLMILAIFLLVVACTWYLITGNIRNANPYKSFTAEYAHALNESTNGTDSAQTVSLPDGSTILLESKSKLSYTSNSLPDKRVVYLTGKASFAIRKDVSRPFLVYTRSSIIKALGTRFEVDMTEKNTLITVSSGNVLVRKRADLNESSRSLSEFTGTLVTPNQQMVLTESNQVAYKTLVKKPALVNSLPVLLSFMKKPAAEVLNLLQAGYGVPILYDQKDLSACNVSADLAGKPFYEQLNLVCKLLHATYEVVDGTVIITSPGCR